MVFLIINSNLSFKQTIIPLTKIQNVGDTFSVNEIDSRIRFINVTLYTNSNKTTIVGTLIVDSSIFNDSAVYLCDESSSYKAPLDIKNRRVIDVGSSVNAYGYYIEAVGY